MPRTARSSSRRTALDFHGRRKGQRVRSVVRALDQRRVEQLAHGQLLSRDAAPRSTRRRRPPAGRRRRRRSSFACSSVSSTVMSFVMLAIGTRARAWRARRTSPVTPFSTSALAAAHLRRRRPAASAGTESARAPSVSAAAATTTALAPPLTGAIPPASANPDPLADPQRVRVDARVEHQERVDGVSYRSATSDSVWPARSL